MIEYNNQSAVYPIRLLLRLVSFHSARKVFFRSTPQKTSNSHDTIYFKGLTGCSLAVTAIHQSLTGVALTEEGLEEKAEETTEKTNASQRGLQTWHRAKWAKPRIRRGDLRALGSQERAPITRLDSMWVPGSPFPTGGCGNAALPSFPRWGR